MSFGQQLWPTFTAAADTALVRDSVLPCPYATLGYSLPFLIGLHVIRHAVIVALLRFLVSLFVCCGAISRIGVYNNSVESKAFHVAAVQGVRGNALHFVAYVWVRQFATNTPQKFTVGMLCLLSVFSPVCVSAVLRTLHARVHSSTEVNKTRLFWQQGANTGFNTEQ